MSFNPHFYTMDIKTLRHSTAHIMAYAIGRLWPDAKFDIGPATDDGFYYDFDLSHHLSAEDFPAIEKEMAEIIKADYPFERIEMSRTEAEAFLKERGQGFKLERLADIPEGEAISFYRCGDYYDLCRGPHVPSTGCVKAFKIMSVAGSYYRGDEKNKMLQRLYGIAAESKEEIDTIVTQLEEAQKRDHRRLGKELDLFSVEEDVGPGLVHWHPKGARIRIAIEDYWRREHFRAGYEMVFTPHIGRAGLWETSGHLGFYKENMYSSMDIDGQAYFVKPMNCPFHIQVYKGQSRSYKDLPIRYAELGTVYRYEKSGVLHGLLRVRGFTQDDAHIFCAPEKIEEEIRYTVEFALRILRRFGFKEIAAYLSTRPAKAVGEPERWEQATRSLENALRSEGIDYKIDEGGGAFYGPKIDLKIKDAIGREWQLGTIQFDFNLPERFHLTYVGQDGKPHQPYMVHRALLGSIERFFGILIEQYAGAFPCWLAPEQVRIIPITDAQLDAARELENRLRQLDVRVGLDTHADKLGAKIRRAQAEKVPFMLILGRKEIEQGLIAVRTRDAGDKGTMTFDDFMTLYRQSLAE